MKNITPEVCYEVYDIINHMEKEMYSKIPKGFIEFIATNMEKRKNNIIDYSKNINEQELLPETRVILSLIYRDYLCEEDERREILRKDKAEIIKYEEELKGKYDVQNIFEKRKSDTNKSKIDNENIKLITIKKESKLKKIINIIKNIFHKKY